jgi:hypothetical protein
MRRLILSLAAPSVLVVLVGCHTAGVCDCDPHHNPVPPAGPLTPVAATLPPGAAVPASAVSAKPEVIKEMPAPEGK